MKPESENIERRSAAESAKMQKIYGRSAGWLLFAVFAWPAAIDFLLSGWDGSTKGLYG